MIKKEEVYRIGRIGKPHGVKGEVQLQFDDDVFDRVDADYLVLEVDGILVPFFMEEYRFRSDTVVLMKFEGIDTQEQARALTGCEVFFPRDLAGTADGEPSMAQIVGFRVRDFQRNEVIGTITGVDDSTINTLFEVRLTDGRDVLIPAAPEFIKGVEAAVEEFIVDLPEGLLDLD